MDQRGRRSWDKRFGNFARDIRATRRDVDDDDSRFDKVKVCARYDG